MRKNLFELYMDKIMSSPLWIKQVIYIKLRDTIKEKSCDSFLSISSCELYSIHIPILTFAGRTELAEKKFGFGENIYNFLQCCQDEMSIIDMCVSTYHAMSEVSKYYEFCMDEGLLEVPENAKIAAMSGFMAGKYRIGEYFRRAGMLSYEQLDEAIEEHKSAIARGEEKLFGEVLCDMRLVNREEIITLMLFKDDADKRIILDPEQLPKSQMIHTNEKDMYENEIKKLKQENSKLKYQLIRILELVKRNA